MTTPVRQPQVGDLQVYNGVYWAPTAPADLPIAAGPQGEKGDPGDPMIPGGDLSGSSMNQTVIKIQNKSVSTTIPTDGYSLIWNTASSQWEPQVISKIQNRLVSIENPVDGYILTWNTNLSQWEPQENISQIISANITDPVAAEDRALIIGARYGRVILVPINAAGEWARWKSVATVCATEKYTFIMSGGNWLCDSDQVTPSGLHLIMEPGVNIVSTLAVGGVSEEHTPFYNADYAIPSQTTHIETAVVEESLTAIVHDATSISVGDRIYIYDPVTALDRLHTFEVRVKVGNTLTLDAPIPYAFPVNSKVTILPLANQCNKIIIEGNGATISGTGDKIIEFLCAWNCHISGLICDTSGFSLFALACDVGGRNNVFEDCKTDGGADKGLTVSDSGFGLEGNIGSQIVRCEANNHSFENFHITLCYGCIIDSCSSRGGVVGIGLTTNNNADTFGTNFCTVRNCTISGTSTSGVKVCNGSHDNVIDGCTIKGCAYGVSIENGTSAIAAKNITISNCHIDGRGVLGSIGVLATDGAVGVDVIGCHIRNCELHHISYILASKGTINTCKVFDATTAGTIRASSGMITAQGGSVISVQGGTYLESEKTAGGNCYIFEITDASVCHINGVTILRPGVSATVGFALSNTGTVYASNLYQSGGSNGVYCFASGTNFIRGENVSIINTTTPYYQTPGWGCFNFGTYTCTGAVGVVVPCNAIQAANLNDIIITFGTLGGTQGAQPVVTTIVAGTSFTTIGTALDTSVYRWRVVR